MEFRRILAKSLASVALTCTLNVGLSTQAGLIGSSDIFIGGNFQERLGNLLRTSLCLSAPNGKNKNDILELLHWKNNKGESFFMYLLSLATSSDSSLRLKECAKSQIYSLFENRYFSTEQIFELFNKETFKGLNVCNYIGNLNCLPQKVLTSDGSSIEVSKLIGIQRQNNASFMMAGIFDNNKENGSLAFLISSILSDHYLRRYPLNAKGLSTEEIICNMYTIAKKLFRYSDENVVPFMESICYRLYQVSEVMNEFVSEINGEKSNVEQTRMSYQNKIDNMTKTADDYDANVFPIANLLFEEFSRSAYNIIRSV